ncbi:MAG TPA: thioredoxin domain-containing protein [Micromonosporaceae bacterium]|jgi:protein-disulfide isomerase
MTTNTKRWPVNPPSGDDQPGSGRPDPTGAAGRLAAARAAAHPPRRWRRGPGPDALRYSPILWVSLITLTIIGLSGYILWYEARMPAPHTLATPAGVSDDGGAKAGITVAGSGRATVEVYYDPMCTQCRTVDRQTRPMLDQLVAQNRIRLVWHPLGLLDGRTDPAGYSTRAANALACAADDGKLRQYADVLFANQPAAGSAGLSDDQLIDVAGQALLIRPSFAACVRDQHYREWVEAGDAAAAARGVVNSPAIFVNGRRLAQPTSAAILAALG